MKIDVNGEIRDMTPEEEAIYCQPQNETEETTSEPLIEFAQALSTATTLAQMRTAAKEFLKATEGVNENG